MRIIKYIYLYIYIYTYIHTHGRLHRRCLHRHCLRRRCIHPTMQKACTGIAMPWQAHRNRIPGGRHVQMQAQRPFFNAEPRPPDNSGCWLAATASHWRCSLNHFLKLAEQRLSNLPMESQDGRDRMKNESEDFHYIKNIHIQDPDPGSWIQGLGPLIPLSGSRILEPGPCTLDPGSMILLQGPRSWTLNPSFWIQNLGPRPGSSIQDHES
jgi:hypothetical protein